MKYRRTRGIVPAAPFREWLEGLARSEEALAEWGGARPLEIPGKPGSVRLVGVQNIAERLGIPERRVYGVLRRAQEFVALETVDLAVTNYGDPGLLNVLYPWDESEAVADPWSM